MKGHLVVDGEVYAVYPCPRREIVRAWREVGGSVTALVGALAHPGERLVHVGDEPPDVGAREPRRPLPPLPGSQVALDSPRAFELQIGDETGRAFVRVPGPQA
ncbi:MAG: hypothetical protein QOH00_828 [Gaiellales bacterium]|nr:hypothetical protein [Gaiellales bacterium]